MKEYYLFNLYKERTFDWGHLPGDFDFHQVAVDMLNEYAKEGWEVKFVLNFESFILEREIAGQITEPHIETER